MPAGRDARQLQVIDPVLTEVARQYRPQGFIYNQVCPTINVDTLSGQYPVYDDRYWFANEQDNKIADRGETPEIEFSWSTDTYLAEDYGLKISITPRERQQAGSVGGAALRLESSKTEYLMQQMANAREKRLAAVLKKVTAGTPRQLNLGAGVTGGGAGVFATSTTIELDFKASKLAVYNVTGLTPNVAIVPYKIAYDMATNATLRDIWKYQVNSENYVKLGADDAGEDIFLPRWFQGCKLLVPKGALAQTAHEGAAKSLTEVWGTSVRFLYVAPNGGGWGIPSTVYQFQHEVISGSARAGRGAVIDRWSENDPRKDVIRAMECIDEKVCAPDAAFELTGAA
jgi:hypothetical protein